MVKVTLTKSDGITKVEKMMEKPQYGGTFVGCRDTKLLGFDHVFTYPASCEVTHLTNDELLIGDWRYGPTGTGEATFLLRGVFYTKFYQGALAESWEFPDMGTIIYHIRKGVHWQNKPPVNGREMDAYDVEYSIKRAFATKQSYLYINYNHVYKSCQALDKWTVELKFEEGWIGEFLKRTGDFNVIVAPEVIEKWGDMRQWESVIGTGPFMIEDFVPGSQVTLVRNPNYWMKDPFFPENQLPYLDEVRLLVITDLSTRLAALRTHKIDWTLNLGWEDAVSVMKSNPELKYNKWLEAAHRNVVFYRLDKPELPFQDIRVRRALHLALDDRAMMDDYYGGNAELMSTPLAPYAEYSDMWIPLEEMPEAVQELYTYNPEKAKQLLAEAGYPDGFKTELIIETRQADLASLLISYWADVGIDCDLRVLEFTIYRSILNARSQPEMIIGFLPSVAVTSMLSWRTETFQNFSHIDDPKIMAAWDIVSKNNVVDDAKATEALRGIHPYILEQAYTCETPSPYLWTFWTPWIKGYSGETTVGYSNWFNFPRWAWCDQELKAQMK